MLIKCVGLMGWVVIGSLLALAACTPVAGSEVITMQNDKTTLVAPGDAGNSSNQAGGTDPGGADQQGQPPLGAWVVYSDTAYKFSVSHPSDFVFRAQTAGKLANLIPRPVAAFIFINPTLASSEVPDEPADLEIRVYDPAGQTSLEGWLASVDLITTSDSPQSFSTTNVTGVKICASTMIAPGCSYFFIGDGWIYELIPTTLEGETMLESFMFVP